MFRADRRVFDFALDEVDVRGLRGLIGSRGRSMGAKVVVVSLRGSDSDKRGTGGLKEAELLAVGEGSIVEARDPFDLAEVSMILNVDERAK